MRLSMDTKPARCHSATRYLISLLEYTRVFTNNPALGVNAPERAGWTLSGLRTASISIDKDLGLWFNHLTEALSPSQ